MLKKHTGIWGVIVVFHLHFMVSAKNFNFRSLQGFIVEGVVVDQYGNKLPEATLLIKGTNKGGQTDFDGKFSFIVPNEESKIIVSYMGYESKTIKVDKNILTNSNLKVVLFELPYKLDEMVVVGHARVKKSDLTGAVTSVKPKDLNIGNVSNAAQMLQGRVAGLYVNSANQDPGAVPEFMLRGVSSLQGSTASQPLVVIDGFPMEDTTILNTIHPNDIAQIDVLKDASAVAIYGSRGANGVIIITTKSGESSELRVDYSTTFSTQLVARTVDVLNAEEYAQFYLDLYNDSNFQAPSYFSPPHDSSQIETLPHTDWQEQVINTANLMENHSLAISGKVPFVSYRFSVSSYSGDAVVAPALYKRKHALAKLNFKKNKFDVTTQLSFTEEYNNTLKNSYSNALLFSPSIPVYDEEGALNQHASSNLNFFQNPLFNETAFENFTETSSIRFNLGVSYAVIEDLNVEANFGFTKRNPSEFMKRTKPTFESEESTAASISYQNRKTFNGNLFLKYKIKKKMHAFDALFGGTYYNFSSRSLTVGAKGFPFPNIAYYSIGDGLVEQTMKSNWIENTTLSALFRVNYNFGERFYITTSYRLDGATQFGENNKWGLFPSLGIAYRMEKHPFFKKHLSYFQIVKIRGGIGMAGNDNISSFRTQELLSFVPVYLGGDIHSGVENNGSFMANPYLRWEQTKTYNLGIEIGVKNFFAEVEFYNKRSSDLLMDRNLPTESGYDFITVNKGDMENKGVELKLNAYTNYFNRKLKWNIGFWFSSNKNTLLDFDDAIFNYGGGNWLNNTNYGATGIRQEGYSSNAQWGYDFIGVWQEDESENAQKYNAVPGDPRFKDINNDESIDEKDLMYLGDSFPTYLAGMSHNISYKNFHFSLLIDGVFDKVVVNNNRVSLMYPNPFLGRNLSSDALERWTSSQPSNTIPSLTSQPSEKIVRSDWAIEDASFIRFREVSLSYNINTTKSKVLKSLQLLLTATNIATLTDYSGLNPDVQGKDTEWNLQPFSRTITLGINASF